MRALSKVRTTLCQRSGGPQKINASGQRPQGFPQLINIIAGHMSVVGPRPEVPKYVKMYNQEQLNVLKVRPGLTDYASLVYFKENELLGKAQDPENVYIKEIMPQKLALNNKNIKEQNYDLVMSLARSGGVLGRILS